MDELNYSENKIKQITEGTTKIEFPEFDKVSSEAPVFYNPRMEFNRDISILAIQTYQKNQNKEITICDLFGGSGIRGIRYKNEISNIENVAINDINPIANDFERRNIKLNNLDNIEIYQKEANILVRNQKGKYDVIDVDPFGTPSFFIDSVSYSLKKDSLLCITATDTSALCGTYKEPCIRKYNAKPYKSEYCHETGLRILIGFTALTLAKYKKYIDVKLSHSSEHYMRSYIKIKKGSKASDNSLKNIGYISHCKNCLYREVNYGIGTSTPAICPICKEKLVHAGPLWLGKIQDENFIKSMIKEIENKKLNTSKNILKLLGYCLNEANGPVTFYDLHKLCKILKISAPKLNIVLDNLDKKGYLSIKTHYNPLGIKTDAPIEMIKKIIKTSNSEH